MEISHKIQEQCRSIGGPEVPTTRNSAFLGATSPMTPGRGQMMSGRGRCFLEVGGDLIDVEKSCRFDGRFFLNIFGNFINKEDGTKIAG